MSKSKSKAKHPDAIYPDPDWPGDSLDRPVECPKCHNVAPMQCYDVGGSDEGCVFCTQCHTEIQT